MKDLLSLIFKQYKLLAKFPRTFLQSAQIFFLLKTITFEDLAQHFMIFKVSVMVSAFVDIDLLYNIGIQFCCCVPVFLGVSTCPCAVYIRAKWTCDL